MFTRRNLFAAAAIFTLMAALPASAAERIPFEAGAFAAAQKSGKPILVEVSAPWCPTCQAQKPILDGLLTKPELKNLVTFEVDFDSRKDVLRTLNVRTQSTLIVYKGAKEMGRSVGDTSVETITAMVNKAI